MTILKQFIVPVGSFGTRFLVATKAMLKDFFQIVEKPLNQYAIEEAIAVDLDNAQHFGVLEEDDIAGEQPTKGNKQLQTHFKKNSEYGLFLAFVSQNEFAVVNDLFHERNDFPLYCADFTLAEISWTSKSKSIF